MLGFFFIYFDIYIRASVTGNGLAANNILRRGIDELGDKINPQPSRAAVFVKS